MMALRAAMTGHLVLSTLHSNDAVGAFQRLQDLGISSSLLEGNFLSIVAQRLVRRLCAVCVHEADQGCEACGQTGYKGRIAIAEVLEITPTIDALIGQNKGRHAIGAQAVREGFTTLYDQALERVAQGQTSLTEVQRVLGKQTTRKGGRARATLADPKGGLLAFPATPFRTSPLALPGASASSASPPPSPASALSKRSPGETFDYEDRPQRRASSS